MFSNNIYNNMSNRKFKVVKLEPNKKPVEIYDMYNDEGYRKEYGEGMSLIGIEKKFEQYNLKPYKLTLFIGGDIYNGPYNYLASEIHDLDRYPKMLEFHNTVYIFNEDDNDQIDMTIDDFNYVLENMRNIRDVLEPQFNFIELAQINGHTVKFEFDK
jgi:hypothetical protein